VQWIGEVGGEGGGARQIKVGRGNGERGATVRLVGRVSRPDAFWFIGSAARGRYRWVCMGRSVGRGVLQSDWLLGFG
jgi:hypothetical protein